MKQIKRTQSAWEQFEKTGEIGAYLLYRAVQAAEGEERTK